MFNHTSENMIFYVAHLNEIFKLFLLSDNLTSIMHVIIYDKIRIKWILLKHFLKIIFEVLIYIIFCIFLFNNN